MFYFSRPKFPPSTVGVMSFMDFSVASMPLSACLCHLCMFLRSGPAQESADDVRTSSFHRAGQLSRMSRAASFVVSLNDPM